MSAPKGLNRARFRRRRVSPEPFDQAFLRVSAIMQRAAEEQDRFCHEMIEFINDTPRRERAARERP